MTDQAELIVSWRFSGEEKLAVVDALEPAKKEKKAGESGLTMNRLALACLVLGGLVMLAVPLNSRVGGFAGLAVIFGLVWLPFSLINRFLEPNRRKSLMEGSELVEIYEGGANVFGEKWFWTLNAQVIKDTIKSAEVVEKDGRDWLMITCSRFAPRGMNRMQRSKAVLKAPVPQGEEIKAHEAAQKLSSLIPKKKKRAKEGAKTAGGR